MKRCSSWCSVGFDSQHEHERYETNYPATTRIVLSGFSLLYLTMWDNTVPNCFLCNKFGTRLHIPTGRGTELKPQTVWVRIPLKAPSVERINLSVFPRILGRFPALLWIRTTGRRTLEITLFDRIRFRSPTGRGSGLKIRRVRVRISSKARGHGAAGSIRPSQG